jgi:hypothetical protein
MGFEVLLEVVEQVDKGEGGFGEWHPHRERLACIHDVVQVPNIQD